MKKVEIVFFTEITFAGGMGYAGSPTTDLSQVGSTPDSDGSRKFLIFKDNTDLSICIGPPLRIVSYSHEHLANVSYEDRPEWAMPRRTDEMDLAGGGDCVLDLQGKTITFSGASTDFGAYDKILLTEHAEKIEDVLGMKPIFR